MAWAWRELVPTFAILFGTALVDVVLYLVDARLPVAATAAVPATAAPACRAHFGGFDLETHEKHRQQPARTAAAGRPAPPEATHGSVNGSGSRKTCAASSPARCSATTPAAALYATDASLFEVWPLAVVRPRTADDVAATVRLGRGARHPGAPRGAGSSLAGDRSAAGS